MLKAIFKPIVILGLEPIRIDQQLLIQNYSSIGFVKIPPYLGHSAPFLLYWAIYGVEVGFENCFGVYS